MDSNILKDGKLTSETIKKCRKALERATPYSDEEMDEITKTLDGPLDFDIDRFGAYAAKNLLEKHGLL